MFVLSPAASYLTANVITVDGGDRSETELAIWRVFSDPAERSMSKSGRHGPGRRHRRGALRRVPGLPEPAL
jgi:hypothetical protein